MRVNAHRYGNIFKVIPQWMITFISLLTIEYIARFKILDSI